MTYTYVLTTDIGRVRRTLPDKVEADAIWTDEEIDSFLTDEGGNWRRATALALETMASDDLLVLKNIKVQNIETSSDRHAAQLLKRAALLRKLADDADAEEDAGAFDIATMIVTDAQYKEEVLGSTLRGRI